MGDTVIPAEVCIYEDRSFTFILKTPPTSVLILQALSLQKGSSNSPQKVGVLNQQQLESIAIQKLPDLNTDNIEMAKKIVSGTALNMGVTVEVKD